MKAQRRVGSFLAVLVLSGAAVSPAQTPAAPPAPAALVAPDPPADTPRAKQLAKTAAAIYDAFTDGEPAFTRDGKRVVFVSNRDGLPQLYVSDAARPDSAAVRLVTSKERTSAPVALPDGKRILFRSDTGADENWSLFVCDLDGAKLAELTPGAKRQRDVPIVADGAPNIAFYSGRTMSASGSEAYSLELAAGASEKKIYSDTLPGGLADVSRDGKRGLWISFPSATDNTVRLIDLATGAARRIYPPDNGPKVQVYAAGFSADGKRVLIATDGGAETALLLAFDGNGHEVGRYAEARVPTASISSVAVAKTGDRIALGLDAGNHAEVRILDAGTLKPASDVFLPLGTGAIGEFSADGKQLAASWSTPDSPPEICAIDAATGHVATLRRDPRPSLAGMPPVAASITEVPAFDKLKLPTNVYLPAMATEKKLPVIVVYHGGPAGSSAIRWSPAARFFTAIGYAVVEPNVRGSGGFGRAFEMADNGPKRLDAFKDVETTARWAASQPWADATRMVVYGGSYGGYTVLIALERWPDVWRAGIDLVGVANMATFLRSTSGLIREIFKLEFGDVDKDAAFLSTISPIEQVDKIVKPLFVYAGANDPRVPRTESDQIVTALRSRNVPVEYMVAADEGHSMARRENLIAFYSRVGVFLEKQMAESAPAAGRGRAVIAGAVWLGAALLAATPRAAAAEPVRDVLQRQTQELFDALGSGKTAVWEKYLDAEVRYVDESGAVAGKKEMVEGVRPLPAGVSGTIRVTDYDARVHGDVAVATWIADENETYHGRELHCRYRTTDTWRKTPDGWRLIAAQVLAMREDPPAVALGEPLRAEYVGRYALPDGLTYEIRVAGGAGLEGAQAGRKAEELRAEAPDVLFVPGKPRYRYLIRRGPDGKVDALIQRREAWDLVWARVNAETKR